ncbi:MAG: M23 family peptidase, partial [Cyanobacteria bacterium P01_F01_bin.3]
MMDRRQWISLLTAGALALGFLSTAERLTTSQASAVSSGANIWRSGSFPVERFQGYTSPFGYRISPTGGYTREFHSGLDFAAPNGAYIRNWWNGRVISVSDHTGCGT